MLFENLVSGVFQQARQKPDQIALITDGQPVSYGQLMQQVTHLAGAIEHLGIQAGDTVALLLQNTEAFVQSYLALLALGVTVVPLNTRFTASEMNPILSQSQAKLIVSDRSFFKVLKEIRSASLQGIVLDTSLPYPVDFCRADNPESDPAEPLKKTSEAQSPESQSPKQHFNQSLFNQSLNENLTPREQDHNASHSSLTERLAKPCAVYHLNDLTARNLSPKKSLPCNSPYNLPYSFPYHVETKTTLATLIFTSGTTGQPKGVMLSHFNIASNVLANIDVLQLTPKDCLITLSPLFHVYGQTNVLLSGLSAGARIVMLRKFLPRLALQQIQHHQVTVLIAVPTMYQIMLALVKDKASEYRSNHLRVCHSGAAPLSVETLAHIETCFGVAVQEGYGLSEASSIVCANPYNGQRKAGSVGLPIAGMNVAVIEISQLPAEKDSERFAIEKNQCKPFDVGELWVRGNNVMMGYYQNPELTAKTLVTSDTGTTGTTSTKGTTSTVWLRTGDLAFQDSDGYIYIVNRMDDLINVGGIKVYPKEIETALSQLPWINQVCVVGIPVSPETQSIAAFVVLDTQRFMPKYFLQEHALQLEQPESTSFVSNAENCLYPDLKADLKIKAIQQIKQHCQQHLADYKHPRHIQIVEQLPQNPAGKILRKTLKQMATFS